MMRLFKGLMIPGCVLGLWQWLVMIQYVKSESLSYPSAIAAAAIGVIQDGTLLVAAAQTFSGALSGWLVGATLGIVVGIAFGLSQTLSRLMKITVETVRPIPSVALIPLALLIYGYGVLLETSVVAFSCFWPLLIVTESAVRGIEPRLIEVSRMLNFNLFDRVIKIILPAALPRIFVGMRLAAAVALVVSVTVEITANPMGLGYALIVAQESMRADRMFAFIGWIGLIGWSLNTALLNIQYRWFGKMGFWEEQV